MGPALTSAGDQKQDDISVAGNGVMGAPAPISKQSITDVPSITPQRQNSVASKSRNVHNLSVAPPPPIGQVPSSSSYTSFSALSPNPPTPRLGAPTLQSIPSSRPGTPSLLGHPRTPGLSFVPLTPTVPAGGYFSPNTPLFSPSGLPATSPSAVPSKASKLKSQITSLLPVSKHTFFHAKIVVEQLNNVPFVGGQFGVRWKLKNVHRYAHHPEEDEGSKLFGKVKPRASSSTKDRGKVQATEANEFGFQPSHQSSVASTATTSSMDTTSTTTSTTWSSTSVSSMQTNSTKMQNGSSTPSTNLSRNFYSPFTSAGGSVSPSSREAQYGSSQYLFASPEGSTNPSPSPTPVDGPNSLLFSPNTQSFSSNAANTPMSPNFGSLISPTGTVTQFGTAPHGGSTPLPGGGQIGTLSAARGITPFLALKDHKVPFNFPLEAIIKMDVTRGGGTHHPGDGVVVDPSAVLNPNDPHSNSSASIVSPGLTQKPNLLPSPLKLVVMQRMDGGDAGSVPQNPKLGEVSLNLAEYVGKGKVERRFLLKESRVNATLKLNIEVTYVSGYQAYVAPPLQKMEILGGIEGFLKEHDTRLSKKKATTMGVGGAPGLTGVGAPRTRGGKPPFGPGNIQEGHGTEEGVKVGGQGGGEGGVASEQEFEVDLLRRGFLEREKDRIGEGLVADMPLMDIGIGQDGWEAALAAMDAPGAVAMTFSSDPYALPSESESESEYGVGNEAEEVPDGSARPVPVRKMTAEALGRKKWKEDMRAKRREERAKKLMLNLSESEESVFQSADEEFAEDGEAREQTSEAAMIAKAAGPFKHQAHVRVAAFDVQRLPLSYGPKTTESLIEALFNPGPTTEATDDDPFVMYVSPAELRERQIMELEYRRELEYQAKLQAQVLEDQERALLDQQQQNHWYKPKRRDTDDSNGPGYAGGGRRMKHRHGAGRAGTMDSAASTSTSGGSGSGGSPGAHLGGMRSPGEETIVGMRMGDDEPDVLSPATITAGRPGASFSGLGLAMEEDTDKDATIGKGSGGAGAVGNFLHSYYRSKKDKVKERTSGGRRAKDGAPILDAAAYVDQEPQNMYGQVGHGDAPRARAHQRSATGGTMSSTTSGSSLSSLGLGAANATTSQGHGARPVPSGPKMLGPLASNAGDDGGAALASVRSRQQDVSVPPGRMDKTGVVKGIITGDDASGLGSKFKGWWKGSR